MNKVFNFNLSSDEVINYAANGTIDAIPANVFLNIIQEYEEQIEEAKRDVSEQGYDNGYDDGWAEAIADMQRHLNGM